MKKIDDYWIDDIEKWNRWSCYKETEESAIEKSKSKYFPWSNKD